MYIGIHHRLIEGSFVAFNDGAAVKFRFASFPTRERANLFFVHGSAAARQKTKPTETLCALPRSDPKKRDWRERNKKYWIGGMKTESNMKMEMELKQRLCAGYTILGYGRAL